MADETPDGMEQGVNSKGPENYPGMENFGPVSSLEPDGTEPISQNPASAPSPGMPEEQGMRAREAARETKKAARKSTKKPGILDRILGMAAQETATPPGANAETDALLLDDAFLKKTFQEVHFPASKEMCLRYVDMEQDFVCGQDRTVNLHNLITHLDEGEFRSRKDLIRAIKERLAHHPHHLHHPGT